MVTCSQPNKACFLDTEDRDPQTSSKGLAEHVKRGNKAFEDVHGVLTSCSYWL